MNIFPIVVVFSLFFVTQSTAQTCGNGLCESAETISSCPSDCTSVGCNANGLCEVGEDSMTCPSDCTETICNLNGLCEAGETVTNCPQDCEQLVCNKNGICEAPAETISNCYSDCSGVPFCGNLVCDTDETAVICPSDCGTQEICGNGICGGTETSTSCPQDCEVGQSICGDGICDNGETSDNCPHDCNSCGDGFCVPPETQVSCPQDCNPSEVSCGNGICENGEHYYNCPNDCRDLCGNGVCDTGEDSTNCPQDCGPKTTGTTGIPVTTGTTGVFTTGTTGIVTTGTTGVATTTGGTGTTTGGTGCMPQCDGKICGSDECGGSCGDCEDGSFCHNKGTICVEGLMVEGKVVDARNGFSIFGAECTISNDTPYSYMNESDTSGEYELNQVKPGEYLLTCTHPEYLQSSVQVYLPISDDIVYLPSLRLAQNPCMTVPPCSGSGICDDDGVTCDCMEGIGGYDCSESLLSDKCDPYRGFSEEQTNSVLIKSSINKSLKRLNNLLEELHQVQDMLPEYMSNSCCYNQEAENSNSGNGTQESPKYPIDLRYISATSHVFLENLKQYDEDNVVFFEDLIAK